MGAPPPVLGVGSHGYVLMPQIGIPTPFLLKSDPGGYPTPTPLCYLPE